MPDYERKKSNHLLLSLYFFLKKNIHRFSKKEIEFVINIGKSFFIAPYTIHNKTPLIKTTSITGDTSSAFFSFNVLINCGNIDIAVSMPATKPIIVLNGKACINSFMVYNGVKYQMYQSIRQIGF